MVSDFRIKWNIIHYARKHGIYVPSLFRELFDKAGIVSFRRGEPIKFRPDDLLCFINSGAVLGNLIMENGRNECHLLMEKQIFYTGLEMEGRIKRKKAIWTSVKNTEITFISLAYLLDAEKDFEAYGNDLIEHIIKQDQYSSSVFTEIQNGVTLEHKISTMLKISPEFLEIKQRHLSDYLMVRPPSLSRSLKNYENKYLI
ncbi:hypothetical protein [Algoriphagus sp.]|jgi:hypothetical protein|uniref:hypothetical protein n=1 Tax=Algoriphagus sp. TaxID=1872435 RepID=UPI002723038F|nr:hypothetical protein [Algoriphagus sp.]MDO8965743.1 hypothetical protein [Algoriphagus sp.]MDP3198838.1 hypothetical protein [Algoriphagus sp.]